MIPVGEFARLTRLSAEQLRSYDALGLLAPARVDERTGYRSYHPRQARTAITIAMLRALDVPLAVIAELLVAEDDAAAALLEAERLRLARQLAAQERALRTLSRLTGGDELMPYPVSTTDHPPRRLLALRGTATAETLHADADALLRRLLDVVPGTRGADAPPAVGLYPLDLDGPVAFTVGVEAAGDSGGPSTSDRPGTAAADADRLDPVGPRPSTADDPPTVVVDLPGGRVARVVHVGPHDELALAYFPLLAWVRERGHDVTGPVVERYLDDPASTEPELLRTEISIPIPQDPEPGDPR